MFKAARVCDPQGLKEAREVLRRIYDENPSYWPHGLTPEHFDGGLYLVQDKQAKTTVGFVGWQERREPRKIATGPKRGQHALGSYSKVGYYSIGILPEYRRHGYAKQAVAQLIAQKAAGVDRVEAMIMKHNIPSQELAKRLGVDMQIKEARTLEQVRQMARAVGDIDLVLPRTWAADKGISDRIANKLFNIPLAGYKGRKGMPQLGWQPDAKVDPKTGWRPKSPFRSDDKLREAALLKGFIPSSRDLKPLLGSAKLEKMTPEQFEQLRQRLDKLHPGGWIIKDRHGMQSLRAGLITSKKDTATALRNAQNQRNAVLKDLGIRTYNPQWMAQSLVPLKKKHPMIQWLDTHLTKLLRYKGDNPNQREYRVHVIGGRAIPGMTQPRSGLTETIWNAVTGHVPNEQMLRRYAEQAVRQLPESRWKNGIFGMDVALDSKGRPVLMETNPSMGAATGGASGYIDDLLPRDALWADMTGRMSRANKLRLGVLGTGVAGGGAYAMSKESATREDLTGVAQLAGAGLAADTALSLGRGFGVANRFDRLHDEILANRKSLLNRAQALRWLDSYGDIAQDGLKLRIGGIPAGLITERLPLSMIASGKYNLLDILKNAVGMTGGMAPSLRKKFESSARHYGGVWRDPKSTLAQEILEGSKPKDLLNARQAYGDTLWHQIYNSKAPTLAKKFEPVLRKPSLGMKDPIVSWAADTFLSKQDPMRAVINTSKARAFGPSAYAGGIRAAGYVGLPLSLLASTYLASKGIQNLQQ